MGKRSRAKNAKRRRLHMRVEVVFERSPDGRYCGAAVFDETEEHAVWGTHGETWPPVMGAVMDELNDRYEGREITLMLNVTDPADEPELDRLAVAVGMVDKED